MSNGRPAGRFSPNFGERMNFRGIAERSSGAVSLDIVHIGGASPRVRQRFAQDVALRRTVRHGESAAGAVVVYGRPADYRENAVIIPDRICHSFEQDDAAAFTADIAVSGCIERRAASLWRERLRPA